MPFSRFVSITEIQKGWSGDKKYRADDADGNSYLLRITNSPRGERYEDMFRMQKKVEALGVAMCNPIEFGKCDEGYYMLQRFVAGVDAEDARMVLPNACTTSIIVTMNIRSLFNFFKHRLCRRAQWEIRALALKMLLLCKEVSPKLFQDAGPSCIKGKCSEGAMSCGKPLDNNFDF